jgi:hypothetical protein
MDSRPSDETLLLAVAEHDMGAFRTLYERHAGWLAIRLARRCPGGCPVFRDPGDDGLEASRTPPVIGSPDAPPLIVSLGAAALGLITLLSLVPARRGNRGALTAIVVTRVISAVLAVPAFFRNAPAWVTAVEGFVIAATITALVLVRQQGRRPA